MKKHFIVYASKNRPSAKISIQASHLSDKYEEPAYGFKDLPHELESNLDDGFVDVAETDYYEEAETPYKYHEGFEEPVTEDWSDRAMLNHGNELYNMYGPNADTNDMSEYDAECYNLFKHDTEVFTSTEIIATEGHRGPEIDDWLLSPGNTWYAVEVFSEDVGASAAGPTIDTCYEVYQAKTPEDALALAQKDHYPHAGVGEVRLATPDEIEEFYYEMSNGTDPEGDYDNWSFGGLIDDEEVIE